VREQGGTQAAGGVSTRRHQYHAASPRRRWCKPRVHPVFSSACTSRASPSSPNARAPLRSPRARCSSSLRTARGGRTASESRCAPRPCTRHTATPRRAAAVTAAAAAAQTLMLPPLPPLPTMALLMRLQPTRPAAAAAADAAPRLPPQLPAAADMSAASAAAAAPAAAVAAALALTGAATTQPQRLVQPRLARSSRSWGPRHRWAPLPPLALSRPQRSAQHRRCIRRGCHHGAGARDTAGRRWHSPSGPQRSAQHRRCIR
jgi:hypothetical protein